MKYSLLPLLTLWCLVLSARAEEDSNRGPSGTAGISSNAQDCVALPGANSVVQLRLYTNGSPQARHLINTFEILAGGETLLQAAGGDRARVPTGEPGSAHWVHNILIDGLGPDPASTNNLTVLEQASGPEWRYIALDATSAYQGRVEQFRRGLLFVEPDLFVIHDRVVAKTPAGFQMVLHPPASTVLDTNWGALWLKAGKWECRIHTPSRKGFLRPWKRVDSPANSALPGTVTMVCGPTNKVSTLDLLTVFAVHGPGQNTDYAFKLLESNTAVGARIHRSGLPTLVAFKTDDTAAGASLTGFGFSGPAGVAMFKPKPRAR